MTLGEKYPTYPRIVQWLVVLREHFREALRAEEAIPNFNARLLQTIKDMQAAVERCIEKLNEDAYIAALLHIGIRDTFFTPAQSETYWARLEELFRYSFSIQPHPHFTFIFP